MRFDLFSGIYTEVNGSLIVGQFFEDRLVSEIFDVGF